MRKLIIIGNGFDLYCGLKSSYQDFFNWRFKNLFGDIAFDEDFIEFQYNIVRLKIDPNSNMGIIFEPKKKDHFKDFKDNLLASGRFHVKDLNRWDMFFLLCKQSLKDNGAYQWCDIENLINEIISLVCNIPGYTTNLDFVSEEKKSIFLNYLRYFSTIRNSHKSPSEVLLEDLGKFEKVFAKYIYGLFKSEYYAKTDRPYLTKAKNLLLYIANPFHNVSDNICDVLSFNYSLDPRFQSLFKYNFSTNNVLISSWHNVHGIAGYRSNKARAEINNSNDRLPAPIFGVDNHLKNEISNDPRIVFTKAYRIVDSVGQLDQKNIVFDDIKEIVIFGHSLNIADRTYFISIFDRCNLYNGNIRLVFYYYPGENSKSALNNRREYTKKVINLLNFYGKSSNNSHGENLVDKLILENRLKVLPNPTAQQLKKYVEATSKKI